MKKIIIQKGTKFDIQRHDKMRNRDLRKRALRLAQEKDVNQVMIVLSDKNDNPYRMETIYPPNHTLVVLDM